MIAAALAEQGAEVPADLLASEVWTSGEPYRRAFHVLSHARGRDQGMPLPIAYPAMVTYAERNGFAESIDDLEDFVTLIQAQDGAHMDGVAAKYANNPSSTATSPAAPHTSAER